MWCFSLEGFYFTTSVAIGLGVHNRFILMINLIFYELSLAFALLVTVIVTFVLIPGGLKKRYNMSLFFTLRVLIIHNANLLFMVIELVNSKIKFNLTHFPFAIIFGLCYVIFSWYIGKDYLCSSPLSIFLVLVH